jgi:hypothetical protein
VEPYDRSSSHIKRSSGYRAVGENPKVCPQLLRGGDAVNLNQFMCASHIQTGNHSYMKLCMAIHLNACFPRSGAVGVVEWLPCVLNDGNPPWGSV